MRNFLRRNKIPIAIYSIGAIFVVLILLFIRPIEPTPSGADLTIKHTSPFADAGLRKLPDAPHQSLPIAQLPAPDMERIKSEGCIADGLLSGYNRTSKDLKVINNSECYYLHRALETWLDAPDFEKARMIKGKITKSNMIYGMFIAEAINKKTKYHYEEEGRQFNFAEMCRKGSKNFWGEHTCKPSFEEKEYRAYLKQITEDAMDIGIQVFMFGQIYLQDADDLDDTYAPEIIEEMHKYADENNIKIIIGAQTNDIEEEEYLRLFDFIEGGTGLSPSGAIENNACYSRWYKKEGDWCWALLWHEQFASKANNVLIHLDWSGRIGDDMSTFTRMDEDLRHQTLSDLHSKFTNDNIGFLFPLLTPLHKENNGCHGPRKSFYSPHMKYECKDLDTINQILSQTDE